MAKRVKLAKKRGPGRPPLGVPIVQVLVRLRPDDVKSLDRYAKRLGATRASALRDLASRAA